MRVYAGVWACRVRQMIEHKIVFTGCVGAGKTTAIRAISEIEPVVTDVANTDAAVAKPYTTVGLDYGVMTLDNGERIRLFGTPGQDRFDFMWRILTKDAIGIVVLIDNSRADPLADLGVYLKGFSGELSEIPCVVGVGRTESNPLPSLDAIAERIEAEGLILPILAVDVRRREDVVMLIETLLLQIEAGLIE